VRRNDLFVTPFPQFNKKQATYSAWLVFSLLESRETPRGILEMLFDAFMIDSKFGVL
jgi:hypothetical protein